MEFEWSYALISIILWLLFAAFWWGFIPVFGDVSYVEVCGFFNMLIISVILLPLSYVIVYMIAER